MNFIQLLSPLFNLPFLSSPLAFVPIYFWSRRHPSTQISLFGLVTITAPYLPIALIAFRYVSISLAIPYMFVDRKHGFTAGSSMAHGVQQLVISLDVRLDI